VNGTTSPPALVREARDLAQILLAGLPERWGHTIGVARRAEELVGTLDAPDDVDDLIAAAWLHDIGYADELRDTGFHPLDGARHLDRLGWPRRLVALVAHHSDARSVAGAWGLHDEVSAYPREESAVADALTYADQTVGPAGRSMTLDQRLAEMLHRQSPGSPNAAVHHLREPVLRAAVDRVERRLAAAARGGAYRHGGAGAAGRRPGFAYPAR
jgi:putative nucleotidyltransferase with HDIG domain